MFNRILFEDEEYLVILDTFGNYKAKSLVKDQRITRKATHRERQHFIKTTKHMKNQGVEMSPDNKHYQVAARSFCDALLWNCDARWERFFGRPPDELAKIFMKNITQHEVL